MCGKNNTLRWIVVVLAICSALIFFFNSSLLAKENDFLDDDFYEEELTYEAGDDPLEGINRAVFAFNDATYTWLFNPISKGYSYVVPYDFRTCFWNFFRNLEEPVRFINCLLQGRVEEAGVTLSRFFINTICGVFGFGDAATREFGIAPIEATLGETLATWGLGDGFYVVIPFYGPSTLRDFSGALVDAFAMTPYYYWNDSFTVTAGIYTGKELNKLSLHLGEYEDLKELSFDPYVAIRNGYFQYRKKLRDHSEFTRAE